MCVLVRGLVKIISVSAIAGRMIEWIQQMEQKKLSGNGFDTADVYLLLLRIIFLKTFSVSSET